MVLTEINQVVKTHLPESVFSLLIALKRSLSTDRFGQTGTFPYLCTVEIKPPPNRGSETSWQRLSRAENRQQTSGARARHYLRLHTFIRRNAASPLKHRTDCKVLTLIQTDEGNQCLSFVLFAALIALFTAATDRAVDGAKGSKSSGIQNRTRRFARAARQPSRAKWILLQFWSSADALHGSPQKKVLTPTQCNYR